MSQEEQQNFIDQWGKHIKNWMRVGLQNDKWVQLYPDGKKFHPWFDGEETLNRESMVKDVKYTFGATGNEKVALVRKWADEVADAYEAANNER